MQSHRATRSPIHRRHTHSGGLVQKVGESYRRFQGDDRWDAIVVGSGIGGLTAAMLMAKYGRKRVLVLERHYVAGGFTHCFERSAYEWDVGLHYIGEAGRPESATRRMFDELTGGRLEWAPMPDVYDRIIIGGRRYDLVKGEDRLREGLKASFPAEAGAIDAYLALIHRQVNALGGYFAEKSVPPPIAALLGGWMRRRCLTMACRTTRETLEELTSNQELIAVLTGQFLDYGLPPSRSSFAIHAAIVQHYLDGAWYPIGGASAIAAGTAPEILERGGRILVSAEVERILVEAGRAVGVQMTDGRSFRAPLVISDAGALNTYFRLLPDADPAVVALRERLAGLGRSTAHLSLYVGLAHSDDELGLKGTNLWIYPDERHEENLARFLANPDAPLPVVYISFPSRKDPSFQARRPGRATIEVITAASPDWFAAWRDTSWKKRGADYDALKARLAKRLLDVLYEQVPQVRGRIDTWELSTPLSTSHFLNYPAGEIYGLDHTPARYLERGLRPRTPIKGLYLTGQDVCSCGVTGAMFGGAMTATVALGQPVLLKIRRGAR
jgi:all-trans-retinol 13,14-reductase